MEIVKVYSASFNSNEKPDLIGVFNGLDAFLACKEGLEELVHQDGNYLHRVWINEGTDEYDLLLEKIEEKIEDNSEKDEKKFIVSWSIIEHPKYVISATNEEDARKKAYDQMEKDAKSIFLNSIENEQVSELNLEVNEDE